MLVVRVTEERFPHAAGVVARAFLDDPMVRWTLGGTAQDYEDAEALEERMTRLFTVWYEAEVTRGMMWETEDGDGACVWLFPEATADFAETMLPSARGSRFSPSTVALGMRPCGTGWRNGCLRSHFGTWTW